MVCPVDLVVVVNLVDPVYSELGLMARGKPVQGARFKAQGSRKLSGFDLTAEGMRLFGRNAIFFFHRWFRRSMEGVRCNALLGSGTADSRTPVMESYVRAY